MSVKNVTLNELNNVLAAPFMTPSSRSLIKAGWAGDIETFSRKLCEYSWQRVRDYTLVVIMLTVIVAASKAKEIKVDARQYNADVSRGDKSKREEIPLSDYIKRKVNSFKFEKLFNRVFSIGLTGNGRSIANAMSKEGSPHGWFARCFLSLASYYDEGESLEVFANFLNRVKKIKPWSKRNYKYLIDLASTVNIALQTHVDIAPVDEDKAESSHKFFRKKKNKQVKEESSEKEVSKEEMDEVSGALLKYVEQKKLFYDGVFAKLKRPSNTMTGWKLHISPKPAYVAKTLPVLDKFLENYHCEAKCVKSLDLYMNEMTGGQAGKFITIYPDSDEEASQIAEMFHKGLQEQGLTGASYFMKIKNDFEVYPGIYARLCDYSDAQGKISRYNAGIPNKVLNRHVATLNVDVEEYNYPFKKLSLNGLKMPRKVSKINGLLIKKLNSGLTWEPLKDLSQISNNSKFELATIHTQWIKCPLEDMFAVAKVTLPKHSGFKIIFVPKDVDKYTATMDGVKYKFKVLKTRFPSLIKCLKSGKEVERVKTAPLLRFEDKSKIQTTDDPIHFLEGMQAQLEKLPVCDDY